MRRTSNLAVFITKMLKQDLNQSFVYKVPINIKNVVILLIENG